MTRKLLIWVLVIILMCSVAYAQTWTLTYQDLFNTGNLADGGWATMTGFPIESGGVFKSSSGGSGINQQITNISWSDEDFKIETRAKVDYVAHVWSDTSAWLGSNHIYMKYMQSPDEWEISCGGTCSCTRVDSGGSIDTAWHNFTVIFNSTSGVIEGFADGVSKGSTTISGCNFSNYYHGLYASSTGGQEVDYIKVYTVGAPAPPASTNFTVTATDEWNSSGINITVWIDASQYGPNITVTTDILSNSTSLHNVTIGATGYFNRTYLNHNVSSNLAGELHQAEICFNATQKVNEAWVTPDNFTIDGTTRTSCFNLTAETHNVMSIKAGWYNHNQSFTITPLQNATLTMQNLSYANLTIYAIDGTTNESLSGYDLEINSIANPTYIETASGVTNHSFYLINDTYNVTVTMPGYATTTAQANVTVSGHTNYTFTLYRANSVTITILDEITNNPITDNITVRWTSNATTWENVTSTGGMFVANLTPANYTLLFYGSNYSTRTYTLSVGNLSTQFLTAYMISSTYSTIFTVKDQDTGNVISDVSFTMYKLVNSTWTTVESKYSDITGKVQVYYDPIGNYRFYLSNSEYEDLIFYLNPILFNTYDVFMVKGSLLNYTVDYDDISIIYSPQTFNNNENTTFNFLISSPDGLLTDYGIELTFPGGSVTASGVNAIGEQLTGLVNISGATRWDRVKLEYNYTTSLSGTRTFTQYLSIQTNATASENTWTANKDRTFGLGLFERVLIVTIIVIFAVGIASMVGQPIPGFAIGLFLFGFMVYLGFIPIWAILPSMLIGVLFLVWKSGGY